MLIASDQGATITVNGGKTWSSWYNQPTAQFYHVITDNRIPYWVYGGQQESGSVGTTSRGDYGAITFREWNPVGAEEYGYVAPDPLDPNIIYGGRISRFDQRSREVQNVSPEAVRSGNYTIPQNSSDHLLDGRSACSLLRFERSVQDGQRRSQLEHALVLISRARITTYRPSYGMYTDGNLDRAKNRGVIYTIAPSFRNANTIWTGSDDGFIQLTA